jgi:hypothetical protein
MVLADSEYIQTNLISQLYFFEKMSDAILRAQVRTGQSVRDCCNKAINPDFHFAFSHKGTASLKFSSPHPTDSGDPFPML